jgi:hypothetical protein
MVLAAMDLFLLYIVTSLLPVLEGLGQHPADLVTQVLLQVEGWGVEVAVVGLQLATHWLVVLFQEVLVHLGRDV